MCNLSYGIEENTKKEERIKIIQNMLLKHCSKDEIKDLINVTVEEINTAEEMLCAK